MVVCGELATTAATARDGWSSMELLRRMRTQDGDGLEVATSASMQFAGEEIIKRSSDLILQLGNFGKFT